MSHCSTLSIQPILVLFPICCDDSLNLCRRPSVRTGNEFVVVRILRGSQDIAVVAFGGSNCASEAFKVAACELECGDAHAVRFIVPTVRSIFGENRECL